MVAKIVVTKEALTDFLQLRSIKANLRLDVVDVIVNDDDNIEITLDASHHPEFDGHYLTISYTYPHPEIPDSEYYSEQDQPLIDKNTMRLHSIKHE